MTQQFLTCSSYAVGNRITACNLPARKAGSAEQDRVHQHSDQKRSTSAGAEGFHLDQRLVLEESLNDRASSLQTQGKDNVIIYHLTEVQFVDFSIIIRLAVNLFSDKTFSLILRVNLQNRKR